MRTAVCITIDIEFNIAGAFTHRDVRVPLGEAVIRCQVNGREEGLGFILDSLAGYDMKATFFVEVLQTAYFGDVPMGRVVERIARAGHDVQLHIHPCWLQFRVPGWKTAPTPSDSCAGRSDAELDEMICIGSEAFARWGLPAPIGLRTGSFKTDRAVYRAMKRAGLTTASNIGLGLYVPEDPELQLSGGRHWIEGVLEMPVLTYRCPVTSGRNRAPWRCLTITGTSSPETKVLLTRARQRGISSVVIATHAHEFVKRRDATFSELRRNRVNQGRLGQLLKFLRRHEQDFVPATFQEAGKGWVRPEALPATPLRSPLPIAVGRAAHNFINDAIWHY